MLDLNRCLSEGGFYAESYRSTEQLALDCLPKRYTGERSFGTAIYFLLTPETFSAMHRLASDEVYHFYLGDPVELLCLREDGSGEIITIGTDLDAGMRPQIAFHAALGRDRGCGREENSLYLAQRSRPALNLWISNSRTGSFYRSAIRASSK